MWYVGDLNNIINMDYVKRIYICKKKELGLLEDSRLNEFVLCGADAENNAPIILKSFDTFQEADMEMAMLFQRLIIRG